MSQPPFDEHALATLVSRLCDDALSDEEFDHLASCLEADNAARVVYQEYLNLHTELEARLGYPSTTPLGDTHQAKRSSIDFSDLELLDLDALTSTESIASTAIPFQHVVRRNVLARTGVTRKTSGSAIYSALAVAAVFYGAFLVLAWNLRPEAGPQRLAPQVDSSSGAKLVSATHCNWIGTAPEIGKPLPNGRLHLREGIAELKFDDGATAVLEGPTEFEVRSSNRGLLQHGKLAVRVPQRAIGFTIQTPTATIVDLGTEFGVVTSESGETKVNVFQGRVSVQLVDQAQQPRAAFLVRAGEAKQIQTDGTVSVAPDTGSGTWNLLAKSLPKRGGEQQKFPKGLMAYWAFDEDRGPIWDSRGTSHGEVQDGQRARGLIGRGAVKPGATGGQLAQIYGRETTGTFSQTISIEAMFISSWSGRPGDYDYILRRKKGGAVVVSFAFKNDKDDDVEGPVLALDIQTDHGRQSLDMPLDGQNGRPTLAAITDGRPHYVAATFDGLASEMAIYVDGVKQMSRSLGQPMSLASSKDLNAAAGESARKADDPFCGVLDEITIYRVAISPEEVARHWKNASHGRGYFVQP